MYINENYVRTEDRGLLIWFSCILTTICCCIVHRFVCYVTNWIICLLAIKMIWFDLLHWSLIRFIFEILMCSCRMTCWCPLLLQRRTFSHSFENLLSSQNNRTKPIFLEYIVYLLTGYEWSSKFIVPRYNYCLEAEPRAIVVAEGQ